jgi:hypothetical protein
MPKTSGKIKKTKFACLGGGPEAPSGRFWTQRIEPKGAALLSETLGPVYFVIKNCGSNNIGLVAGYGDLMDIRPGHVRATYAHGIIRVENRADEPALIEFEVLPITKR